ncbi:hypothetical protein Ahy_A04g018875 [Arachis hypogaea]|uniref:At2g35280-like TPR domain-containing protein n=1 Tax=Arachis hypogaea TaxID=3818 RepID=A0A445DET0_ARAHY|nr:hypothetical protein Ahy_A04g018875 [Arachis hypogaea]
MTCKATREAGDENIVRISASIPGPHAIRWSWYQDPGTTRFFHRCKESGHPELQFWDAIQELLIRCHHDVGMQMLHNAEIKGHDAAKYALSMMLLIRKDDKEAKK